MLIHSVSLEESLHLQIAELSGWVDWIAGFCFKGRLDLRALVQVWVAWIDGGHGRDGIALCEPSSCELRLFSLPAELCLHDTFTVLPMLNGWYQPRYVTIPAVVDQDLEALASTEQPLVRLGTRATQGEAIYQGHSPQPGPSFCGSLRQRRGSQGLGGTGQGTVGLAGIDGCYPLEWLDQPLALTHLCLWHSRNAQCCESNWERCLRFPFCLPALCARVSSCYMLSQTSTVLCKHFIIWFWRSSNPCTYNGFSPNACKASTLPPTSLPPPLIYFYSESICL